jgi:hypothetical protein
LIQDHRDSLLRPGKDLPPFPFVSLRDLELAGSILAAQHNPTQHNQTQPNRAHNQTNLQANGFTTFQNTLAASPFPTHLGVTQYQQASHSFSTQNCSISSSYPARPSNKSLLRKSTYSQGPFESQNPATIEDHSPNSSSLTAYQCTKYQRQYKHRRSQRRHFQVYHTKESQQTCPYCIYESSLHAGHGWRESLYRHQGYLKASDCERLGRQAASHPWSALRVVKSRRKDCPTAEMLPRPKQQLCI